MNDDIKTGLLAIVAVVVAIGFFIMIVWGLPRASQRQSDRSIQQYKECKAHTDDIEWCFRQFRPNL